MNLYLLMAGDCYGASGFTDTWIGCYSTREDAESQVSSRDVNDDHGRFRIFEIRGKRYDWYHIEDLTPWVNGD